MGVWLLGLAGMTLHVRCRTRRRQYRCRVPRGRRREHCRPTHHDTESPPVRFRASIISFAVSPLLAASSNDPAFVPCLLGGFFWSFLQTSWLSLRAVGAGYTSKQVTSDLRYKAQSAFRAAGLQDHPHARAAFASVTHPTCRRLTLALPSWPLSPVWLILVLLV